MAAFNQEIFNELIMKYYNIKRILQNRPLSIKQIKRDEYLHLFIDTYNAILSFAKLHIGNMSIDTGNNNYRRLVHCKELLVRYFGRLDCGIYVSPDAFLFKLVNRNVMSEFDSELGEVLGTCFDSDQEQNTAEPELEQITIGGSKNDPDTISNGYYGSEKLFHIHVC